MSSGYQALLKSLDETDDITRGLGRSIKIKKRRKHSSCCCCWCCSSRPWVMWSCISLAVLVCMTLSVGVPIILTAPVESSWHWSHWVPKMAGTVSETVAAEAGGVDIKQPLPPSLQPEGHEQQQKDKKNWTMPVLHHTTTTPSPDLTNSTSSSAAVNATVSKFINEAINQLHHMIEWTKEKYDRTPKIPLIVGLSLVFLVLMTVLWLVIYRRLRRRQRRRTLGKMVTDLQSGKTLLNSDDSESD